MGNSSSSGIGGSRPPSTTRTQQASTQATQKPVSVPPPPKPPPPSPKELMDKFFAQQKSKNPNISETVAGDVSVANAPRMSPAQLMALASKGFAATLPKAGTGAGATGTVAQSTPSKPPTAQSPASSLASEVLNDGSSNCLESAYESARPGDQILLYRDADDPVGHAVVQRPDGSISDPNEPGKVYASRAEWEAAHTDYHQPVSIPQSHLRQVFAQPPGPQRDAVIQKLGLTSIAYRQVADGVTAERQDALRFAAEQIGNEPAMMEQVFAGTLQPGPLTAEERAFLVQQMVERSIASGDAQAFSLAGSNPAAYPELARALGHAFEMGAVTPEMLGQLMGPDGLGRYEEYSEFAELIAASGSDALQSEVAGQLWALSGGDLSAQAAALTAAGSSGPAAQRLIDTAGVDALTQTLTTLSANSSMGTEDNVWAQAVGGLMSGLAELPRSETTDRLGATVLMALPPETLQNSSTVRGPVAQYLSSIRFPGDTAAQQADTRNWEAILQNTHGASLLFNPQLPVEARQANLLFFLQRPNFNPELLNTYQGNLGSIAAAEVQTALGNMDPANVNGAAELPAVPGDLAGQFPAIANLPQPVTAESLQGSIPNPITPAMAADYLDALASSIAATGNTDLSAYTGGDQAMATLFNVIAGNPIQQAHLDDFSAIGVAGLRELAQQIRGSSDPAFVAQALTLGGIQHDTYFDNLGPFVDSVIAQRDQILGNITGVRQLAETACKTGVSALAMAAGGPVAAAAANAALGSVFAQLEANQEGRELTLPNLVGGAILDFGVGALAPVLGARAKDALGPVLGRLAPVIQGLFEAAGGQAADILRDPAKLEELWASGQSRDDLMRALILGTVTNSIPWDSLTPNLKGQIATFLRVDFETQDIASELLKGAAMQAATIWFDPNFQARLRSGEISPEQAVQEMQASGVSIFGNGTTGTDPATTEAMLRILMSSPETP
ncbi:hypothetical protein [Hyalangium gracile]|uniref:hypothetical protein n=1 Tax=Hyalangium gracile TaxID=394092 RepID=UPI001CCFEB06|nr:hypothetical protein [Hyalangium gracile]